jgi:glycosyltransferase involved in cell wall biosynthesis
MSAAQRRRHAFVVPAYGTSVHLPECLDSIAAQRGDKSDVLITTSTPSDDLAEIASRFSVPLVVNPRRANIGSDWNFAYGASDADIVTLAHQDDTYTNDYVERIRAALSVAADATIAFSDYVERDERGPRPLHLNTRIKRYLTRRAFGTADVIREVASKRRMLSWGNPVCCPSVALVRAALPDFAFTEAMHSNLDWEAWLRLAGRPGAFVYVREPLVTRRIHTQSETSALIADNRRFDEDRAMFRKLWPAPVAALISQVYRASYLANRT